MTIDTRYITPQTSVGGGKCKERFQSDVINWLRFPMIVMVAYIHYFESYKTGQETIGNEVYNNLMILMSHVISRAAVPTFFLVSGYYFFHNTEFSFDVFKEKFKKRLRSLFVPYVLWISLFIILTVIMKYGGTIIRERSFDDVWGYFSENGWLNMYWNCNEWPFRMSWIGKPLNSSGPIFVPLWFVRDLVVCCIMAPFIHWCIKHFGVFFLGLFLLRYFTGIIPSLPGFSINVYFVIGAYLAINGKNIIVEADKIKEYAYWLTAILLPFMVYYDGSYTDVGNILYPFWVFVLMVSYINIAAAIVSRGWLRQPASMPKSSFFIYCLHAMFVMGYCGRFMMKVIPSDNWFLALVRYMLVPLLCVAICYTIYMIMNRYTPKLLAVLTGNRN